MKNWILMLLLFILGLFVFQPHIQQGGKTYRGYVKNFHCGKVLYGSCFFEMTSFYGSDIEYKLRTDKMTQRWVLEKLADVSDKKQRVLIQYAIRIDEWDLTREIVYIQEY